MSWMFVAQIKQFGIQKPATLQQGALTPVLLEVLTVSLLSTLIVSTMFILYLSLINDVQGH